MEYKPDFYKLQYENCLLWHDFNKLINVEWELIVFLVVGWHTVIETHHISQFSCM